MATHIPLRHVRFPKLQRQCLFLRHPQLQQPLAAAASSRAFSSTARTSKSREGPDLVLTRAMVKEHVVPSPRVLRAKLARVEGYPLTDDIGLLQNTVVRAGWKALPWPWSREFYRYFWILFKSKAAAMYSRIVYHRMIAQGMARNLPVDAFKGRQLTQRAKNMYTEMYTSFNNADKEALKKLCLQPLARKFRRQIATRNLDFTWELTKWISARIVSHRAAPIGEEDPGTGYRQLVIRLESEQILTRHYLRATRVRPPPPQTAAASSQAQKPRPARAYKVLDWIPEEALRKQNERRVSAREAQQAAPDASGNELLERSTSAEMNGKPQRVVDYLVLQIRSIRGVEEEWKVWGFTGESTLETIEQDEQYWSDTLAIQTDNV